MVWPTRWAWVWVNSGSWWWTVRPGVLRFMGSQRVGHDWATELNWTTCLAVFQTPPSSWQLLLDVNSCGFLKGNFRWSCPKVNGLLPFASSFSCYFNMWPPSTCIVSWQIPYLRSPVQGPQVHPAFLHLNCITLIQTTSTTYLGTGILATRPFLSHIVVMFSGFLDQTKPFFLQIILLDLLPSSQSHITLQLASSLSLPSSLLCLPHFFLSCPATWRHSSLFFCLSPPSVIPELGKTQNPEAITVKMDALYFL